MTTVVLDEAKDPASPVGEPAPDAPHLARLRPYQREALRNVSSAFASDVTRVLVVAPTGAGKGDMAVAMMLEAVQRGFSVLLDVHRSEIPRDLIKRLARLGFTRVSLIMGDAPGRYDPGAKIHLMNIASARHRVLPQVDLLIEDEAHRVLAPTYLWLREQVTPKWIAAFTATPVRLDRRPLCLAYDKMIVAAQPSLLLEHGWLARARVFSTDKSKRPNIEGVKEKGGDFDAKALSLRANTKELVGDIVTHWLRRASDLTTIVFACDIEHSKSIAAAMNAAGISAEHIDGEATGPQREAVMERLRSGATRVVVCMSLWLEGIDLPELKCAVLARPTLSITVYLQGVGRIMRPYEGLNAVVLDHAGNVERFGLPQADREWSIEPPKRRKKSGGQAPVKRCECGAEVALGTRVCPECGYEFPPPKAIENVDGELVEVTRETAAKEATNAVRKKAFERFWLTSYRDGFDADWVTRRYAERFGDAPPADWTPPERTKTEYTTAQKHAQLMTWMGVAQRQKLPHSWIEQKYLNKFMEPVDSLDTKRETQPPAPEPVAEKPAVTNERVELEF